MLHILYLNGQYTILCQNRSHEKTAYVSVSHPSMKVGSRLQFSLFPFQKVYKVYQEREWSADRTLTLNGPT